MCNNWSKGLTKLNHIKFNNRDIISSADESAVLSYDDTTIDPPQLEICGPILLIASPILLLTHHGMHPPGGRIVPFLRTPVQLIKSALNMKTWHWRGKKTAMNSPWGKRGIIVLSYPGIDSAMALNVLVPVAN